MTDYKKIGSELGALLESKQAAYGNVFGVTPAIIGLLFPDGIPVLAYRDLLTIVRMLDKVGRICTAAGKGDPMGEDPWRDIAGYAMLMLGRKAEEKPANPGATTSKQFKVRYGDKHGWSTWGEFDTREEADSCATGLRKGYPYHFVTVLDENEKTWCVYEFREERLVGVDAEFGAEVEARLYAEQRRRDTDMSAWVVGTPRKWRVDYLRDGKPAVLAMYETHLEAAQAAAKVAGKVAKQRQDELDAEDYLASHATEPAETVDDDPEPSGDDRPGNARWAVRYGNEVGASTWAYYETEASAVNAVTDELRAAYPYHEFWVSNVDGKTTRRWCARGRVKPEPPSNDWALTWQGGYGGPFIEAVFPTREAAMAKHAEMAAKQSRLTWRVCRVDEVGK